MVEDHRRHAAVDVAGRALISRTKTELRRHPAFRIAGGQQRWRQCVADPDDCVTPPHALTGISDPNTECAVELAHPQPGHGGVDIAPDLGHGLRVGLGSDSGVDQGPHRLGEGFINSAKPRNIFA